MESGKDGAGRWRGFLTGLLAGAGLSVLVAAGTVYALNMLGLVVISATGMPSFMALLNWAYSNLRLSVIPFAAILLVYVFELGRLNRLLQRQDVPVEQLIQREKWVDISASLFFGTGVIWTAIGMRSALVVGIGGLDQTTAGQLGAFEILRRLVDGGILLALSTTIVGAVGGYLMRVGKALAVGARLERYHDRLAQKVVERIEQRLESIDGHLGRLATGGTAAAGSQPGAGTADAPRPARAAAHGPEAGR